MRHISEKLPCKTLDLLILSGICLLVVGSPVSARFISPDNWDPTQEGVGTNRYAYSHNDPINRSDPNGHADAGETQYDSVTGKEQGREDVASEAAREKSKELTFRVVAESDDLEERLVKPPGRVQRDIRGLIQATNFDDSKLQFNLAGPGKWGAAARDPIGAVLANFAA